jgi:hypothetical protein
VQQLSINPSLDWRGIKHTLNRYTTLELVSVLAHAEDSRRQMNRFVESITAELTRRGNTPERVVSLNPARRFAGVLRSSRFSPRRERATQSRRCECSEHMDRIELASINSYGS